MESNIKNGKHLKCLITRVICHTRGVSLVCNCINTLLVCLMGNIAEFMLHMPCMKFISFCRKLRTLAQIDIIE